MENVERAAGLSLDPLETPLVILSEGCFGQPQSKLALGVIRYGEWPIAAVLDSTQAGQTVQSVTGMANDAPIVSTLPEALALCPKALLIGTAPAGGQLPPEWKAILVEAIQAGLHIINGLHFFLSEDSELTALARTHRVRLWDVRDPEAYGHHKFQVINRQQPRPQHVKVVTMVGTDCSVGKMHTALELHGESQRLGTASGFIATGQTGILITGRGVPLDRVIGDFMAGAMEICIQEENERLNASHPNTPAVLWIEGQGSLMHPAYSGVTLSLLHGSNPDAMILCHKVGANHIRNYPQVPLPSMKEIINMVETAAQWVRPVGLPPANVVGISVNTSELMEDAAQLYLAKLAEETGLPVTDPVRYGVSLLLEALSPVLGMPLDAESLHRSRAS